MYRRVEHQAVRLHEMMNRLSVDAIAFARLRQGEVYAEARARCLFCSHADTCLAWLASDAPNETAASFCPNVPLFECCLLPHCEACCALPQWSCSPAAELAAVREKLPARNA